jgi:multidrug efflux pump
MPEALWLTLQEGDLAREIPATELRVPRPPRTSQRTRESGRFAFIQSDLHFDGQQVKVQIDRDRATDLGIDMGHLAAALATMLSEARVNYFSLQADR